MRAQTMAQRRYPYSRAGGKQDACRHCIWSGLMTVSLGARQAGIFAGLHENFPNNPWRDRWMDTWNNTMGAVAATGVAYRSGYREIIRDRCIRMTENGTLRRYAT